MVESDDIYTGSVLITVHLWLNYPLFSLKKAEHLFFYELRIINFRRSNINFSSINISYEEYCCAVGFYFCIPFFYAVNFTVNNIQILKSEEVSFRLFDIENALNGRSLRFFFPLLRWFMSTF